MPDTPFASPTTSRQLLQSDSYRGYNYVLEIHLNPDEIKDPPITRTISCPSLAVFHELHQAIQIAFGWANDHRYDFKTFDPDITRHHNPPLGGIPGLNILVSEDKILWISGGRFTSSEPRRRNPVGFNHSEITHNPLTEEGLGNSSKDLWLCKLFDHPSFHGLTFEYEYDHTARWRHKINLIGHQEATNRFVCTDGEGHRCADGVGGPEEWNMLVAGYHTTDPTPEQRKMMKWYECRCPNGDPEGLGPERVQKWSSDDRDEVNQKLMGLRFENTELPSC
ncbi:hypothetical protein MMC20_008019 [Loxospora ochrophaea]|nr:hypothetical protein [Loxospora ochrophaea]